MVRKVLMEAVFLFISLFILQVAIELVSFPFSSTTPTKEVLRAKPSKDGPLFS